MQRILRILSVALVTAGLVILTDAAITLAWKEPLSALYAQLQQDQARSELDSLSADFLEGIDLSGTDDRRVARRLADAFEDELRNGKPIGTIEAPSAGFDYVIIQGTGTNSLQKGPGHYPDTALPGQGRTIGIAGHRTTYGAPFRKINQLEDGDRITVEMPYATFTYVVEKSRIVEPTDVEIVRDVGRERLVLTACHPLYSAAQRYAVFGRLAAVRLPSEG
jgi:sortase A